MDKIQKLTKKIFSASAEQKKKASVFLETKGNPDFLSAIKEGNDNVVYAHLMTGFNAQDALALAMQEKKSEYFKLILKAPGIDINKRDKNNHTLLYNATVNDNDDCMKLLFDAGADVSELNERKCLADAVYNNNIGCQQSIR